MAKNDLIKNLYFNYARSYNHTKKETSMNGNSMDDVAFYYINMDLVKEFSKNYYQNVFWDGEEKVVDATEIDIPEWDTLPTMNSVMVTRHRGRTLVFTLHLIVDKETGRADINVTSVEGDDNGQIEAEFAELSGDKECVTYSLATATAEYLCTALVEKETYLGRVDVESRTLSGKEKIIPLVYISNKKYLPTSKKLYPNVIEWKHSWEVLGHWRKISSIGKNRDGVYGEIGRTWVNPCIKGDGDLVKKIRIIKTKRNKSG